MSEQEKSEEEKNAGSIKMTYNNLNKAEISYEPSDKRRFYRLTTPVKVIIDNKYYKTADWSVNAFKISDYSGFLDKGNEFIVFIEINFQGFTVKFEQKAKVLRKEEEKKTLVAEFIAVSQRNSEILSYFSKGLITGEFQSFDDIIKHIDIPVSDDSIQDFLEEQSAFESKSFNRRTGIFIYIIAGFALLLYILNFYYTNAHLLKVDSAFVTGKTEILNSPSKGILKEIYVKEEEVAEKESPLFKIINPKIEREIEEKKNKILKNEAILKEKQKQLSNLIDKLEIYKKDFSLKLKVQEKIIESIAKKIDLLEEDLDKKTRLYEKKLISKPELDAVKKELLENEQELAAANYQYYHIYENINDPESGTDLEIHKRKDSENLKAEIERIKEVINIDKKELSYIKSFEKNNIIKSPFKAFTEEILAFKGKFVDEKTPIVKIKDLSGKKLIEAYLSEEQALKLKLGLAVNITIPSRSLEFKGRLMKLEKREEIPGKNIIIALIKPSSQNCLKDVISGTPASIVFVRNKLFKQRYKYNG